LGKIKSYENLYRKNKRAIDFRKGHFCGNFNWEKYKNLLENFEKAIINGKNTKFPNQRIGLSYILKNGNRIKILSK